MKTTIDIADELLDQAKAVAQRDHTTLKSITEQGLRMVLAQKRRRPRFKFMPIVVGDPDAPPPDLRWERLRQVIYGDEAQRIMGVSAPRTGNTR